MTQTRNTNCVVTRLTPQGRGAVAVLHVEGASGVACVGKYFVATAGRPLASVPLDRIVFGRWGQADGNGEEIVVCRTSETSLEVNCHGGVAAARAIVNALVADGAVEQTAESWVCSHSGCSFEAEAWLALAVARTERTAAMLLDQYRGALRDTVEGAIEELKRGDSVEAGSRLTKLLARGDIGLHLTKPWRVVFAGPPNVGKSSLMNCLLGYQRSIVFDQPGTTRDLLSAPTAFDGWSLELTDTAGLRESEDAIELEGVSRATNFLTEADLTVLVFDATCGWETQHEQLLAAYPKALAVINKCDLQEVARGGRDFLATSALTGDGVPELTQRIVKQLVCHELVPGEAVPFTARQLHAIEAARQAIDNGQLTVAIASLEDLNFHRSQHRPNLQSSAEATINNL
ncbi:MAG: GTPase [Planctomycetota bacterium]